MVEQGINWWQEWPSESPDLNPIEMVWNRMKRFIGQRGPQTKEDLIQSNQTFWAEKMSPDVCRKYIEHNFKVVPVCIHLGGATTSDNPKKLFKTEQSLAKDIAFFQRKFKETISYERNLNHSCNTALVRATKIFRKDAYILCDKVFLS